VIIIEHITIITEIFNSWEKGMQENNFDNLVLSLLAKIQETALNVIPRGQTRAYPSTSHGPEIYH
jgi:hypothetical protein